MASPKDPKATTEAELAAVKAVIDAVQNIDPASRMRVMRAAEALLPPPGPPFPPQPPPGAHPPQQNK